MFKTTANFIWTTGNLIAMAHQKCPYISPLLNCLSTGKGSVLCLDKNFHEQCSHRHFADKRMGFVPVSELEKRGKEGKGEDKEKTVVN